MVVHKHKKVNKYRGSVTHGGGSRKKRRGAGSRGGRGKAGTGKRSGHKKLLKVLGKRGFTSQKKRLGKKLLALNVGDLDQKVKKWAFKEDELVDLAAKGIGKLLGAGAVKSKLKIRVASFSKQAEEKIKKADGEIVGVEKEPAKEENKQKEAVEEND